LPQITIGTVASPITIKAGVRRLIAAGSRRIWAMIPKALYLGPRPSAIFIALTRKCNANCVFCAYQFATKEERSHMPIDLFDQLIEHVKRTGIKQVMLSPNIGEPTIAPNFIEKVKRIRQAGVRKIEMTTNALYLHKIGIDNLLTDGPDVINISFAGFDKEMYERDFRVKHYERTRDNILELLRANQRRGRPRVINFWLRGDATIEEMMAQPEVAEVRELADKVSAMTEVDNWIGLIKQEALPPGYKIQDDKPRLSARPCRLLLDLTVHPDGDIHLCSCRNVSGDPDMRIGNLKEMSLAEAHAKIPNVLRKWEAGMPPKTCQSCSMYNDPAIAMAGRIRQVWGGAMSMALSRPETKEFGLPVGGRNALPPEGIRQLQTKQT
jgi:radical SAM protein with 4Fe4S-binding SPASM domain